MVILLQVVDLLDRKKGTDLVHMSSSCLLVLPIAPPQAVLGKAGYDAHAWNDSSEWFSFFYEEQEGRMFFPSSPVF